MILDTLERHADYHDLLPGLAEAFTWLSRFSLSQPDGRYDILGDTVFALVQSYVTTTGREKPFEAHRQYLDLQYVASGEEFILHAPLNRLRPVTAYHSMEDYQLYTDPSAPTTLRLSPGDFVLFHPHDGHKPGCAGPLPGPVRKVVIKIRSQP